MNRWFKDGISIEEERVSVLVVCLILCILFGGVMYALTGHIDSSLVAIINSLVIAVSGVNAVRGISDIVQARMMTTNTNNNIVTPPTAPTTNVVDNISQNRKSDI